MSTPTGYITSVRGAVVSARIRETVTMSEQMWIGEERLTSEVIAIEGDLAVIQVYEDTTGLRSRDPVFRSGRPLSAVLGPGLLGSIYDGIQRPLPVLKERSGIHIQRGIQVPPLDTEKRWHFKPAVNKGNNVSRGAVLGTVQETALIEHRIMVPPRIAGELVVMVDEGDYTVEDEIAVVKDSTGAEHSLTMQQQWHVRRARPVAERLSPAIPLVTGQRVIDTFFPIAKGGPAAVPGGFGTGKTVLQHSLAQWSDAKIIVYIGCGERGNEMTEVLEEFPELSDPWSGRPLMERTILIANTSNMPVAARESSIYTGVTIAEYYRDQGYDVAVMADSTSRWAQALREISGRLGEMPIEEGYPAYLPSRLAAFYERAGRVNALSEKEGSVTIIGAVSPPGGDFSEPVTRHTQRFTQCWWALSRDLAHKRHYPAIDWLSSYSLLLDDVSQWWEEKADIAWRQTRHAAMNVLHEESSLQQLIQLVGPEALSDRQRLTVMIARLLREGFLQQNALNPTDAHAVPEKQIQLLELFMAVHDRAGQLLDKGVRLDDIRSAVDIPKLIRLKDEVSNEQHDRIRQTRDEALQSLEGLAGDGQS